MQLSKWGSKTQQTTANLNDKMKVYVLQSDNPLPLNQFHKYIKFSSRQIYTNNIFLKICLNNKVYFLP